MKRFVFLRRRHSKRAFRRLKNLNECGYVALEFCVAMGLLVLPTALILLQIPNYLERSNRLDSVASVVSKQCANIANSAYEGNLIANDIVSKELDASSVLNQVDFIESSCVFESPTLDPGTIVESRVVVEMPAALVPGADMGLRWTMSATHQSVIPKYRSFEE